MYSYHEKLDQLITEGIEKIRDLISLHKIESKHSSFLCLPIIDDDLMYNLDGGRYLIEFSNDYLIDNNGYTYSHYALDYSQLSIVIDHLINNYNDKYLEKYKGSTLFDEPITKLIVKSNETILVCSENYKQEYSSNSDNIDEFSGDYIICSIHYGNGLNVKKY